MACFLNPEGQRLNALRKDVFWIYELQGKRLYLMMCVLYIHTMGMEVGGGEVIFFWEVCLDFEG